ncbi:N-acetyltransferase family protein [Peribacillus frigoritolerans]|uniref:GNAT family N-acetyltransferase n=1 Tax=Peribacillus frigoritolerans TaxID=450367 RepID=UPI003D04D090
MGIGKKLIKELFFKFEELGFKTIFVEVLEDNKSRYFYEAFGAELNLLVYEWRDISPILL